MTVDFNQLPHCGVTGRCTDSEGHCAVKMEDRGREGRLNRDNHVNSTNWERDRWREGSGGEMKGQEQ